MTVPWHLVALAFAVCLVVAAPGFLRVYYFVSLCYAGAIAAQSLVFALLFSTTISGWVTLQLLLLLIYGVRLGAFLAVRERNPAYAAELARAERRTAELKLWHQIAIWLGVSLLFTLLFLPALLTLSLQAQGAWPVSTPLGVMIMAVGLWVESLADWQKYRYKAEHPRIIATPGCIDWCVARIISARWCSGSACGFPDCRPTARAGLGR